MRLHRLEITAFGPFSGTEVVDFDALSQAGLFLIHGQTGAGKTSVLDAVCFALYGKVPGARADAVTARGNGLRSDHAAPGVAPKVVLETTIRGRRFRITRSPAWTRPKRRGQGTTSENASVILEELTGSSWTAHTTRLDEAGDLLGRLLGMNVDQFCQVAMLPQGAFAAFLRAGAEERRAVLEKLFAAEIFAQVEKWLEAHRAETRREAEALQSAAESTADRISEVLQEPRPADELLAWATETLAHQRAIRTSVDAIAAESAAVLSRARGAADQGRALAERRARRAEAEHRAAALGERAPERAALAERLELAARADKVVPLVRIATERARRCEQAARHAARARAEVGELVPDAAPEDVLAKAERERLDQIAGLDRLRGDAARLGELSREIAAHGRRLARLEGEDTQLAEALSVLPDRAEEQRGELQAVRERSAMREGAVAAVEEAGLRLEAARRRDRLAAELAQAEDGQRAAIDAAQDARDRLLELRRARLEGMAAELAGELVAGEACPVCGSQDHPAPAVALALLPGEADEQRAQEAADRTQRMREEATGRVAELRAALSEVRERAGDRTADALALELGAAEAELGAIDEAVGRVTALDAEVKKLDLLVAQARDRREAVVGEVAATRARQAEAGLEAERLSARLDEARGEDPTLDGRMARLAGEAKLLRAAAEAVRLADAAEAELAIARTEAAEAAYEQGFASPDAAAQAGLPEDRRAELAARARALDDEEAAIAGLLAAPDLVAAAAQPAPDLTRLEAELAEAEHVHAAASRAADRAAQRCDRLAGLRDTLAGQIAAWRPAAERQAVATRLAGVANGNPDFNTERTRLSAYVLSARLVQVVAAANERLGRMSGGRYALKHTVERTAGEGGRRHGTGGLGLRVTDAWTGQERDPATLSGGESFISSLSLALGLADVVTAEVGGTEIGTLFVDEGFGTLDEETLDEVMDVLDGLRDGGRAVGIVSHVAELRSRIPVRLYVRKGRNGSHTEISTR